MRAHEPGWADINGSVLSHLAALITNRTDTTDDQVLIKRHTSCVSGSRPQP